MAERNLAFFMNGKAEQPKEKEVYVSKRYKDEEDKIIPFVMKAITTERLDQLADECTDDEKGLDRPRYLARIAVESTVYPDFKNSELLKSYGVVDPVDAAKKVLSVGGEYNEWIKQAQVVNGYFEDFEKLVEEAKN
jgi:hypothetical protein